jgi:hypothetical protein
MKKYSFVKELTEWRPDFLHQKREKVRANCRAFPAQRGLALPGDEV